MSNITPVSKRVTIQTNTPKKEKTKGDLGKLHVNDWENRGRIRTDTLHLVSHHLQELDWGPTRLKKQS